MAIFISRVCVCALYNVGIQAYVHIYCYLYARCVCKNIGEEIRPCFSDLVLGYDIPFFFLLVVARQLKGLNGTARILCFFFFFGTQTAQAHAGS